jgi:diguanylate cyclase (GGDEF)-like protein
MDAEMLRNIRQPTERRLLGMPVRVWTLALWFIVALIVDAVSFALPYNNDSPVAPRILGGLFIAGSVTLMIVLGDRTPTWFLHVLIVISIGFMLWFTAIAETPTGSLTAMMILLIVAAYTAYTMSYVAAVIYVGASAAGMLASFAVADRFEILILPWAVVTFMGFAQIIILGTLVSDLKHQVVIDPLTGLLNRAGLDIVTAAADGERTLPQPRSIVVIDLDDFKAVNDENGHAAGDRVLSEVGDAILQMCRKDDIAVRYGGDEFILLLPSTDDASAVAFAGRIEAAVAVPCSTGVTRWSTDETLHHAIARADRLMYQHKAERRGL